MSLVIGEEHRIGGLDIWVVPEFAQTVLDVDPAVSPVLYPPRPLRVRVGTVARRGPVHRGVEECDAAPQRTRPRRVAALVAVLRPGCGDILPYMCICVEAHRCSRGMRVARRTDTDLGVWQSDTCRLIKGLLD